MKERDIPKQGGKTEIEVLILAFHNCIELMATLSQKAAI
jgi:hypothetical protein